MKKCEKFEVSRQCGSRENKLTFYPKHNKIQKLLRQAHQCIQLPEPAAKLPLHLPDHRRQHSPASCQHTALSPQPQSSKEVSCRTVLRHGHSCFSSTAGGTHPTASGLSL